MNPVGRHWHGWRLRARGALLALLLLTGCASDKNSIVEADLGKEASPEAVDRDPWALLPAGPVAWAYLDAQQLFASRFGDSLLRLMTRRLPALQDAGFEPRRDLRTVQLGIFSIQGADLVGVVTGRFDRDRIEAAVENHPVTPLGVQLTKTRYAERTLFMAETSGFCILTQQTALFGNQMGMRRAIDRIQRGKLDRQLPDWLERQLSAAPTPIVLGMNLTQNPLSEATRSQLPFLNGMETIGILANFQEPGMHLAGTASYADGASASQGARHLEQFDETLQSMGWLMALFGIAQPLRSLSAEATGEQARFVAEIDGALVDRLLIQADGLLPGATASPAPASAPAPATPPAGVVPAPE